MSTTRSSIVPCLWFDDQAEEAARFYVRTFPAGRVTATSRYAETADNPARKPRGSVLTVELEVAGQRFTALNGGPLFSPNPSISFFYYSESKAEVERLAGALGDGGAALMPLGAYPWSPCYSWVKDRFGVSWQVMQGQPPAGGAIAPCLMFAGPRHGKAEAAMQAYTRALGGHIERIERYAAGEGPEGTVKHGRFVAAGQAMTAMDSHIEHGFAPSEGVSLQVMCRDQAELDRRWELLSEGGEPGPCGWLKDRFGFSWQVVPDAIVDYMTSTDSAARDRAFAAVMGMKKLDIAAIQAAFEGRG